jgi:cyanophycin synthetase
MKIIKKQVLRGPNMWSNYRKKLIQVKLDLEEMEEFPTDKIPGFAERIKRMLPTMIEHECSEGVRGGFFERVERGTWLGHVMEHVALEIQSLAGMDAGYGRTRGTGTPGVYHVVFSYEVEEAGLYAIEAAFNIVQAFAKGEDYDINKEVEELRYIAERRGLGPSTKSIVQEAESRGIPWFRVGNNSLIQLGHGKNQTQFQATITSRTSNRAVNIAGDKEETKRILSAARIPVPQGDICKTTTGLFKIISEIGYPIVVKPLDGNQGKGATINISDDDAAVAALEFAKQYSNSVIVEKYIAGFDFRLLVVDNKYVAASKRIPAHVIGDGVQSISELLEMVNMDPRRGDGHGNVLTKIIIDRDSEMMLSKMNYTLDSVPPAGEMVFLKSTANLSTGGTAVDVTDEVHPENIFMAERIGGIVGLDICGIDVMASDLSIPLRESKGAVLEVNAAPGLRMHLAPSEGQPRNVAAAIVDMLYPPGKPSRVPLIAITGTNGKTTTSRLMAYMAKQKGYKVGFTTTDGIYLNDYLIEKGDTTGPISAQFVLRDPSVDFAVLETARGGILRAGLAFDECDIAIVTNIKGDHLGINDINTIEELANVKAVVPRSAKKDGWAILNAEDEYCVKISSELSSNVAWFSLSKHNDIISRQIAEGKPAMVVEDGWIVLLQGDQAIKIEEVTKVPISFEGTAHFMVANAMAASLAAYLSGFEISDISGSLRSFVPGYEQTPGRLNMFEFKKFRVLVDYAHNVHGYAAMESYLKNVKASRKIGIISGIGDRRPEDIKECAATACRMFDHVIIRQDHSLRGRSEEEINNILLDGIASSNEGSSYETISDEAKAVRHALDMAQEGDLIVALSDVYQKVVEVLKFEQQKELMEPEVTAASSTDNKSAYQSTHNVMHNNNNNNNNNYYGRPA